ncbi:hypothetical protein [Kurthia massiliensis]|uniref:hypothetical protein n=1 Tax=Kurthia massiliensis TaxID=1033739 RepID=UPI000287DF1B|nr:hypothetical protein [Kurthia massiliensis]
MASLLSIDWDYFISTGNQQIISSIENERTIHDLWYKRYFEYESYGKHFEQYFRLAEEVQYFWQMVRTKFQWGPNVKVFVSDSHALSYKIAHKFKIDDVYLFDAHSDLGYGGLASLDFEVNCANWLGKLLKQRTIQSAHIIYSPFTCEHPTDFDEMNRTFDIHYPTLQQLPERIDTNVIHICRSGAWSPPWFDTQFVQFVKDLNLPYQQYQCDVRDWDPQHVNFSQKLQYMMS